MTRSRQSGQAVVEYVLLVLMVFGTFAVLRVGFLKLRTTMFGGMCKTIVAPCPGCPAPEDACK